MSAPFEYAMKYAGQQKDVIKKEFIVYRRVNDKIYITKTTRKYMKNDFIDSHETTVL